MNPFAHLKTIDQLKGKYLSYIGRDYLLQLANEGVAPCHRFVHPYTKKVTYLFDNVEIRKWIESNFLERNIGKKPGMSVCYFIYVKEKGNIRNEESVNVPDELKLIPNLFKLPLEEILTPPGIYFLCQGKKIVYIGKSINIGNRISQHLNEGGKQFDSVYYIPCGMSELEFFETCLIRYINPEYNQIKINPPSEKEKQTAVKILNHE